MSTPNPPPNEIAPPRSQALTRFQQTLVARRKDYADLLPREVPPEAFIANAMAYAMRDPMLLDESKVDRASLMHAIMDTARLGLMPHGIIPGVHLIRFWSNRKGMYTVAPVTDYRAEIELATRSDAIRKVTAMPVYAEDEFDLKVVNGDTLINHEIDVDASIEERGVLRGVYAVVKLDNEEIVTKWLNVADLKAVRDSVASRNKGKAGVWDDGPEGFVAMALKTAIRRALKLIPKSATRLRALALASAAEERVVLDQPRDDELLAAALAAPAPSGHSETVMAALARPADEGKVDEFKAAMTEGDFTAPSKPPKTKKKLNASDEAAVNALATDADRMQVCWEEGEKASGDAPCPYPNDSDEAAAWSAGFMSGHPDIF